MNPARALRVIAARRSAWLTVCFMLEVSSSACAAERASSSISTKRFVMRRVFLNSQPRYTKGTYGAD